MISEVKPLEASSSLCPKPLLTSVPRQVVAALCCQFGPSLSLDGTDDGQGNKIDGARLLWAISGCESSFGADCKPRHESAYDVGGYYYNRDKRTQGAVNQWGRDAACSFGPWQVLCINSDYSPEQLGSDPSVAAAAAVHFIEHFVLGFRKARTLAAILDTYNSGNWQDANVPLKYIHDGTNYYFNFRLP